MKVLALSLVLLSISYSHGFDFDCCPRSQIVFYDVYDGYKCEDVDEDGETRPIQDNDGLFNNLAAQNDRIQGSYKCRTQVCGDGKFRPGLYCGIGTCYLPGGCGCQGGCFAGDPETAGVEKFKAAYKGIVRRAQPKSFFANVGK